MRVRVFQHVPFEGLGAIEPWLVERGASVAWTRFFEDPRVPAPDAYDWLVVLGGPMSVNDEAALPWLRDEKRAIAAAIDAGRIVLGVCLGAQLVASALGAKVSRNREPEIGWFPVERVADPAAHPVARALPARADAFHWHGETFALPPGALHVARSEACEMQAFAVGPRVVGLQFHLETTPEAARALVRHCAEDLRPGPFVQAADTILSDAQRFERLREPLEALLHALRG